MMSREKITPEDEAQLRVMDRMERMSQLHAYSRSLLGFSPIPFRSRIRAAFQAVGAQRAQAQAQPANPGNPTEAEAPQPTGFGFGLFNRFQQLRPQQLSPEEQAAEVEKKTQLMEQAEAREAEEQKRREAAADLERVRNEDFSGVQVSG